MNTKEGFPTIIHHVDFCVVGGGLSGLCAAVSAARHGAKVALLQDRPMLGGNASSEVRMWVCGAHGKNNQETGLVEELFLENLYRNPDMNYSIWDGIMYEKAAYNDHIELLLNCTCTDCHMEGGRIISVSGWQMTTQTWHTVYAELFADCSGDSVLAPLTGAEFRIGREAREEFGEDIAPVQADRKTMGMSCMIQAREETHPSTFIPPKWAYHYTKENLPYRIPDMRNPMENFWYLELGGESDAIIDAENVRDELLRVAYGIWDFVKNDPENKEKNANWRLDWMGILPGKRESRRYVGDHILTQNEVRAEGRFEDLVAYGGWSMDDHDPAGFRSPGVPTIYHPAPSPYGIPYRCMYSVNIGNLMFAGRNISVTHTAMSSTRVMATCATIGQAVGTAAAIAVRDHLSPRGVYEKRLQELKQTLMEDDSYLPFNVRKVPELTKNALLNCSAADAENLRNGLDRPIGDADNGITVGKGDAISYIFDKPSEIAHIRIIFDSDLNRATLPECEAKRERNMLHNRPLNWPDSYVPKTMVKAFRLEGIRENGTVVVLVDETNNYQRYRAFDVHDIFREVRLIPLDTWGCGSCHIFSFDVR